MSNLDTNKSIYRHNATVSVNLNTPLAVESTICGSDEKDLETHFDNKNYTVSGKVRIVFYTNNIGTSIDEIKEYISMSINEAKARLDEQYAQIKVQLNQLL